MFAALTQFAAAVALSLTGMPVAGSLFLLGGVANLLVSVATMTEELETEE